MNKQIKVGILVFSVVLLISVILFLFFSSDRNIDSKQRENKEANIDSNLDEKENNIQEGDVMENQKIKLTIHNHELIATLNNNASAIALVEKLKKGPITVNMTDYANMEKVGSLGMRLPSNDEEITTSAGDLILYQGDHFVIYYDTNHWMLTRLGKIDNLSAQELKDILGNGDITVKLSLNK